MRLLDVTRDVVQGVAPEELPLLAVLAQLDDAEILRRRKRGRESDPLGFGLGRVVLVTPIVWVAVHEVADRMADVAADGMRARIGAWLRRKRRRHQPSRPLPHFGETELREVQAKVEELARNAGIEAARAEQLGDAVAGRLAGAEFDHFLGHVVQQDIGPGIERAASGPDADDGAPLARAYRPKFYSADFPDVLADGDGVFAAGGEAGTSAVVTLPVTIYLSEEGIHDQVEAAVADLLDSAGLKIEGRDEPVIGSWFRRMRAAAQEAMRSPAAREGALVAAHAADTRLVLAQDAAVTATLLQNLGPVVASLQPTKDAVLRVGALLIVKVDWGVSVFQLTAAQQAKLDHQPRLAVSPHEIIAALDLTPASQNGDGPLSLP